MVYRKFKKKIRKFNRSLKLIVVQRGEKTYDINRKLHN